MGRSTLAGEPATMTFASTSRVTTLPAATMELSPMVTPGRTMTPAPSHTLFPMWMGLLNWSCFFLSPGDTGCWAVTRWQPGPIRQSSPRKMSASSTRQTLKLKNTFLPTWRFFSPQLA